MKKLKSQLSTLLFLCVSFLFSCNNDHGKFVKIPSDKSNIHFTNRIFENDSVNIFDFANIYNGGGVGVGDFNNDGLQDLYFTGNMVSNKLYLNKGKMHFEDITTASNTDGKGVWSRGVAVVDINNDGRMDMYVCATAKRDPNKRINILYVNKGVDKNGVPVFQDMAKEYGLADTTQSTMAYFFDYDNDGDLDLYIAVNHIVKDEYTNAFKKRNVNGEHPSTGKLYRNDWNDSLKHPFFTDVSRQAGILIEGYTHAADIFDANNDGWLDILETNDYISNNVLYINNHDGTFKDSVMQYFKHTAANSMGSDAVDINNDGFDDVIEVDMAPQDNLRKKMFSSPNSYQTYQNSDLYGYQYQYVRNMIQLNQGPTLGQLDSIKHPIFSDVGYLCGIAETDWSWTPLVADFDNDGNRDIIFTNGFPKDITDHDFITFRRNAINLTSKKDMLSEIPEVKIHNYVYRNNGRLSFSDYTTNWGLEEPSFSNGAVYADLDNDGDMDVVINNIADSAFVYENKIGEGKDKLNFLSVKFTGTEKNINGIGARIELHFDHGKLQEFTNMPYRGYISSVEGGVHFGLDKVAEIDSVMVKWPDGKMQLLKNVKANQVLNVNHKDASDQFFVESPVYATNILFRNITDSLGINILHKEDDFVDFNVQKLVPHKLSDLGPGIAAGDVNGDGLQDLIVGGSLGYSTLEVLQQPDGKFISKPFIQNPNRVNKSWHDMGILLFDADNDNDLDLYVAAGGNESEPNSASFNDKFYINDGKGNFKLDTLAFPANYTSKSCVRAVDYDKDGDLDLFVSGRVDPWNYPKPVSSFILRNDTQNGHIQFTDVTATVAKDLINIGLTCDALFTDFNNDGWPDLILAGEWMPLVFLENKNGVFKNVTAGTGIGNQLGWWNSLAAGDFDNDGDIDYVAGNLGQNSFYRASDKYPVSIYAKDFDDNKSYDAFPSLYLPASLANPVMHEYPAQTRDDIVKQMIGMRSKFQNYKSYANATMDQLFSKEQLAGALILKANNFKSSFIRNDGNNKFTISDLPQEAQFSVLNGMIVEDFDGDGNLDVAISGNDFGTEVSVGRNDALNGLLLKGDGKGNFIPQSIIQSGLYLPGNGKALVKLASNDGSYLFAASQNRGPLEMFQLKGKNRSIALLPDDASAMIKYHNGKTQKQEFYYGSSYLSQSARWMMVGKDVGSIIITNNKGKERTINF